MQDEPKSLMPTHPIARTLIENLCHLFPEEIPTGLPPKRDIRRSNLQKSISIISVMQAFRMIRKGY